MNRFAWLFSLVAALMVLGGPVRAGGYEQQWAHGSVILTSGDTIDGPVIYHHEEETLEIRLTNGTARTFAAINVSYFVVSDEAAPRGLNRYSPVMMGPYFGGRSGMWMPPAGANRRDQAPVKLYVTYMWDRDNDYSDFRAPAFFQQLTDGNTRLLKREKLVQRSVSPYGPYGGYGMGGAMGGAMGGGYYTEVQNSYFLADPQGNITPLRNTKKDLLAYFGPNAKRIQTYVKENRLSYSDPNELPLILRYADSLGEG